MAGSVAGGLKASATNKERHGNDYYKRIGAEGGKARHPNKGFGGKPELARIAGAKGGSISRRGPAKKKTAQELKAYREDKDAFEEKFNHESYLRRLMRRFPNAN